MATFKKLFKSSTIKKSGSIVEIYKFQKEGTERTFFAPEVEGQRISSTMYARRYDAEKLARAFCDHCKKI